jgi:tetratricopeptide (TPR) repeat protein
MPELVAVGKELLQMKFSTYTFLTFIFALSFLGSCQFGLKEEVSLKYSKLLIVADSLSDFNPGAADSLYMIVISDHDIENTPNYAASLLGIAMLKINQSMFDTARLFIEQAGKISENLNDTSLLFKYYFTKASLYHALEYFDKTEECFVSGLNLAELAGNESQRHTFLLNLCQVFVDKGMYVEAMKSFTDELKHSEATGNEEYQAIALQNMANIASLTNDYGEAIRLSRKSLAIQKKLNLLPDYADQLQNLGIYYKNMGVYDSAFRFYREALSILSQSGDTVKMIRVHYNMGNLLKNQQKFAEAEKEMKEVIHFCKNKEIFTGHVYALSSLATIYANTNRVDQGLAAIDSSLLMAKRNKLINLFINLYEIKHTLLAGIGRYNEAYQVLVLQQQLTDSLLSLDKQKEILALKTRYETEKKDAENALLKKENEIQKSRFWLLLMVFTFGIFALVAIIYVMFQKQKLMKQQKMLADEKSSRIEQEKKNKEIELEKIQIEKQIQEQELVYQSLVRTDLIHVNRSVKEKLTPFRMLISRKKDQEDFAQTLSDLTRDAARDPMAEFEILFRQIHPSFYEKLLLVCPDLSKTELQVSALIRLNLSTKDIARLTNLNITTIEITRHHIRKKLNLDQTDTLTTFLISI